MPGLAAAVAAAGLGGGSGARSAGGDGVSWRRSSRCGHNGNCVEVRLDGDGVLVRDGKHPDGPVLAFTAQEWTDFVASLCAPVRGSPPVQRCRHQDNPRRPSTAATAPHSGHPRPTDRNEDR